MRVENNLSSCQVLPYNKFSPALLFPCKVVANLENLSQLISRRLSEVGMSKSELAKRIGKSRAYVTDLANGTASTQSGQYRPKPEVLAALAKHLQVPEVDVLNAAGYNAGTVRTSKPSTLPELLEALDNLGIEIEWATIKNNFDGYTPDDFEELKEQIAANAGVKIRRVINKKEN